MLKPLKLNCGATIEFTEHGRFDVRVKSDLGVLAKIEGEEKPIHHLTIGLDCCDVQLLTEWLIKVAFLQGRRC